MRETAAFGAVQPTCGIFDSDSGPNNDLKIGSYTFLAGLLSLIDATAVISSILMWGNLGFCI